MIESLDLFFNDFGVDCSNGAINFKGILDCPDGLFASDMVISTKTALIIKTSVASQLVGTSIIVDGTSYKITSKTKIDDGKLTKIELGK